MNNNLIFLGKAIVRGSLYVAIVVLTIFFSTILYERPDNIIPVIILLSCLRVGCAWFDHIINTGKIF